MMILKNVMPEGQIAKKAVEAKTTTKLLDFFITGFIVLIFLLCPLFFTGQVFSGAGFEKMILFYFLVLLGVVAWVTKGVLDGELELKRTPLDWPILAFLVIYIVATIFSVSQRDSLIGSYGDLTKSLSSVILFFLFYYLVVNNINAKKIKIIFWTLIISSSLVIVYSLLQLLGLFVLPFPFTKFINFNSIGSLFGLTMFIISCLSFLVVMATQIKEVHPRMNKVISIFLKIVVSLIIAAGLAVLALLNGFTFWLGAIVGIVIILMFFLSKIIPVSNNNFIIPLAIFLFLVILLVLGNFSVIDLNLPTEVSLSRGASWDIAKNSLKANPILGSGPATFYYDFSRFRGDNFNNSPLWNVRFFGASGILFELMATVGALGTIAFVVIGLIVLSICFLSLIKNTDREVRSLLLALFSSFIVLIIFSLLFSFNSFLALWTVLISILAVSSAIKLYPEKFKSLKLSFRSSPKYALALAAIFLCISAGVVILFAMGAKMYLADVYVQRSMTMGETDKRVNQLERAVTLFPYQDNYYLLLADNYMALANQEVSGARDQAKIENSLSRAIEMGKKAVDITPDKVTNNESLALIYENASFYTRGALEWAENLYNKIRELEPSNPTPFLRLALINMAKSNAEQDKSEQEYYINEAIKKYDEAIAKKNDLSAAFYGKAIAYEKLNNIDEAIEQLKKSVILDGNNIDYRFELGRLYFNRGVAQPKISQDATKELVQGEDGSEELSVESSQQAGTTVSPNNDLATAEQLFNSVYQLNPNHANALYSLALLYQKLGETSKAKEAVKALLGLVQADEAAVRTVEQQFPGLY